MAAVGARAFIIVELFRLESRYARMGAFAADFKARRPWQTKQARWRAAGFPGICHELDRSKNRRADTWFSRAWIFTRSFYKPAGHAGLERWYRPGTIHLRRVS